MYVPFPWQFVKLFTTNSYYATTQCSKATEIDCTCTSGSVAIRLPMAEAISPQKGSDQHHNIIWHVNKSGVQIQSTPDLSNRGEHLPVITRGTAVTYGTELYFSVSSYGHPCPWPDYTIRWTRHLVFSYNTSEDNWFIPPECEVHNFGLAIVVGLVTVVGCEFDLASPSVGPPPLKSSSLCFRRAGWILKSWTICSISHATVLVCINCFPYKAGLLHLHSDEYILVKSALRSCGQYISLFGQWATPRETQWP